MVLTLPEIAKSGEVCLLNDLLKYKPNILEEVNPIGNTALHLVTLFGKKSVVAEVYDRFPRHVSVQNSFGDTPFHIAARINGSLHVVEYLIEKIISNSSSHDQDVESGRGQGLGVGFGLGLHDVLAMQNQLKNTTLHEALRYRQRHVAKLLISKDPELCSLINDARESPLYISASNGLTSLVRQILRSSRSNAYGGPNGLTALHAAARGGHEGIIIELLEAKPELVKEKNESGRTALHHAVVYRFLGGVDWLLHYDRSVGYIQDRDGQTPLHIAASGINIEIIKILVKYCPDSAYQVNRRGQNILHVVMRDCSDNYYSRKIFQYLVKQVELTGLLNQPDQDGNTPLHLATIAQHQHFLEILKKDDRVDRFVINKKKMTAQECCIGNEKKIVKLKKEDKQRNSAEYSQEDYAEGENERLMLAKEERQRKKEQLSQTHIIVAMLIATITFAAAIQMPGGYDSDNTKKGMATLAKAAAFKAFVVSDSIALASSMLVVYLHFDETLRKSLGVSVPDYHEVTTYLMFISINGVMLAFMTGVYAVLMATKSFWVGIVTIVVTSVVPVIASTTATLGYALGFIHRHISISKTLLAIVIIVVAFAPAFAVLGVLCIAFLIWNLVSKCPSHRFVTVSCHYWLDCLSDIALLFFSVFGWALNFIRSLFV